MTKTQQTNAVHYTQLALSALLIGISGWILNTVNVLQIKSAEQAVEIQELKNKASDMASKITKIEDNTVYLKELKTPKARPDENN